MHRVVILALDGVIPFELGIPTQIFGTAADDHGEPLYDVVTCSLDGLPVRTNADFSIAVRHGPEAVATADTLVVPAAYGPLADACADGHLPDQLGAALALARPGTRFLAICTGASILAAAGLLDGRPATTHWSCAERFQKLYPLIRVDPNVLFVDDGDVLTSAGLAAAIDLCLHVVRRDHGSRAANSVARSSVLPPWRDGRQVQYVERPLPKPSGATTAPTRAWALENLHRTLTLADLAGHARMSTRSFTRHFRGEVGMSPGQWLTLQRVELARHLLECTDLPIDRVAEQAGFGTSTSLRQHLHATIGVAPATYRRTFQADRRLEGTH